jgi:multisubunit Na+/H+ antiporter MnhB subunit
MNTVHSVILARCIGSLYWLLLAAAFLFLLRGHNAPGGGFIAAMVAVTATLAVALVFGSGYARTRMPLGPLTLAATGLLITIGSGLPGLVLHGAYLTQLWGEVGLSSMSVKLTTVLLYDLGVMLCVWGSLGGFCLRLLEMEQ